MDRDAVGRVLPFGRVTAATQAHELEPFMTRRDFAQKMGCSVRTIDRWLSLGMPSMAGESGRSDQKRPRRMIVTHNALLWLKEWCAGTLDVASRPPDAFTRTRIAQLPPVRQLYADEVDIYLATGRRWISDHGPQLGERRVSALSDRVVYDVERVDEMRRRLLAKGWQNELGDTALRFASDVIEPPELAVINGEGDRTRTDVPTLNVLPAEPVEPELPEPPPPTRPATADRLEGVDPALVRELFGLFRRAVAEENAAMERRIDERLAQRDAELTRLLESAERAFAVAHERQRELEPPMTAAAVSELFGRDRRWVYAHADLFGGYRIRNRLLFDRAKVEAVRDAEREDVEANGPWRTVQEVADELGRSLGAVYDAMSSGGIQAERFAGRSILSRRKFERLKALMEDRELHPWRYR